MLGGLNIGALLCTLAVGYIIFVKATKESQFSRTLGLIVSWTIMALASLLTLQIIISIIAMNLNMRSTRPMPAMQQGTMMPNQPAR